jgi:hypothetical protein
LKTTDYDGTNWFEPQTPRISVIIREVRDPIAKEMQILEVHRGIYFLSYAFWSVMISLMVVVASLVFTLIFGSCLGVIVGFGICNDY